MEPEKINSLHAGYFYITFCRMLSFSKFNFCKKSFRNTIKVSISLDPDLCPNSNISSRRLNSPMAGKGLRHDFSKKNHSLSPSILKILCHIIHRIHTMQTKATLYKRGALSAFAHCAIAKFTSYKHVLNASLSQFC